MIMPYAYPKAYEFSELYHVSVNKIDGEQLDLPILKNPVSDFGSIEFDEEITIEVNVRIIADLKPHMVSIRPLSRGITCKVEGRKIIFTMKTPQNIKVAVEGLHDLYLYCFGVEDINDKPIKEDPDVFYFSAGQTYEVGKIELKTNQTLYIEAGAVVRGVVHGVGDNIKIMGRGIIDGGFKEGKPFTDIHTIQLEHCNNSLIKDVTIINPMRWIVVIGGCNDIVIRNIKELGLNMSTDGIDVCGSKNVLIEDCFIKCNDDCVVIKSIKHSNGTLDWRFDVENVTTRGCVFQTVKNGAVMEIGHELITDLVNNIVFEDCDVLGVHGHGSVFSIQNTDKAIVSNVLYKNIRIEHCYDKLINLRIMNSMYSRNNEKGQVRDIKFKDIFWHTQCYNMGYTISLIGGLDENHTVENVEFENFIIDGKKVTNLDDLNIHIRHASNISIV